MAMKLFLSAFEYAWAPFYFATMQEPDAKRTFSLVTTYGVGGARAAGRRSDGGELTTPCG